MVCEHASHLTKPRFKFASTMNVIPASAFGKQAAIRSSWAPFDICWSRATSSKRKLSSYSSHRISCTVDHGGIVLLGKSTPCHSILPISITEDSVTPGLSIVLPINLQIWSRHFADFDSSCWAVWIKFMARKSLHVWVESADMACISALHNMAERAWSQVFKKLIIFLSFIGVMNSIGLGNAYNFGPWVSRMRSGDWSMAFSAFAQTGIASGRRGLSGSKNLSCPAEPATLFLPDPRTNETSVCTQQKWSFFYNHVVSTVLIRMKILEVSAPWVNSALESSLSLVQAHTAK